MRTARSIWRRIPRRAAPGLPLMALLMLALGGCATQAATPSRSPIVTASSTVLATATTAAPTPTATFVVLPDTASSYGPACVASQLKLSIAIDYSSSFEEGRLTNSSTSACSLFGFPGAQLFDASQPIRLQVLRSTSSPPWGGVFPEQRIQLAPGAVAYFEVKWSSASSGAASSCSTATHFALTPPNDTATVLASDPIHVCGDSITVSPFTYSPSMIS